MPWFHGVSLIYDCIDEGLDVALRRFQPQPDGPHHDCEAKIHGNAHPVRHDVTIALDKRPMQQRQEDPPLPGVFPRASSISSREMCRGVDMVVDLVEQE